MGKLFTLLIVFAAGFVTALYYVSSGDENYQANDKAARIVHSINHYTSQTYNKVTDKISHLDQKDNGSSYNSEKDNADDSFNERYAAKYDAPYDAYEGQ
jgi:hypothetical protein